MKHNKKYLLLLPALLIGGGLLFYQQSHHQDQPQLMHYQDAKKEFEEHKQQLRDYYLSGAYDKVAHDVCKKAEQYFASLPVTDRSLVIFNIDDTAVYRYQNFPEYEFVWSHQPFLVEAKKLGFDPAIKPVLELYNMLKKRGIKAIFLSGRSETLYDHTLKNLIQQGYTDFEGLILFPDSLLNVVQLASWKEEKRKALSEKYTIVGNIGGRPVDFGPYSGYEMMIRNYLY